MTQKRKIFRREHGIWYLFLLPALVFYGLFVAYPFAQTIYLSLTSWNGVDEAKTFIGGGNYTRLLGDTRMWLSLGHNVVWAFGGATLSIAIGLLLALFLWDKPLGYTLFRTTFFMPQVIASIVIGIVWSWVLAPRDGLLNRALDAIGMDWATRGWLGDPSTALIAVMGVWIWAHIGFHLIILLAGLQGVDEELIDAARVDGASAVQRFQHAVLPQLRNVLTLVTVLALVAAIKVFDLVFIMTGGGPANQTELIATYTYTKAFIENEVGYGSALSMLIAVLGLATSVVVIRLGERGN